MSDLIIPTGFSIETTTGETLTMQPGQNLIGALPGGSAGEPLFRITAGQPRNERWREADNQLYAVRKMPGIDQNGKPTKYDEMIGPFGETLVVRAVGLHLPLGLVRSYMPKFDPNASDENRQPICHSEDGLRPDAQYYGKFSTACVKLDPRSGKVVAACPMAQWGAKDPVTSKSQPPMCQEQYLIIAAFQDEHQNWITAELYFKGKSAPAGRTLVQQLSALTNRNLPLYAYPIRLSLTAAGVGNTYIGVMQVPTPGNEAAFYPNEEDIPELEAAAQRAQIAFQVRAERAARLPENPNGQTNGGSAADVFDGKPQVVTTEAPKPSGNGKAIKPMI